MKKIAWCVWGLLTMMCATAQQKPHYTQYVMNQYIVNPAITGIENYTDVKFSHRHQWIGIADAPVTTYFTIHTAIGKKDYRTTPTSFDMPGENPRGKRYWDDYTTAAAHHGVGLQVINDRTGPLNRFSAYATYAYHIGLTTNTSLAAGIGAGVTNISIESDKLEFNVPVDPAVYGTGLLNRIRPDINAGLYLYSADYFAGISVQQLIPQKVVFSDGSVKTAGNKQLPHFFATAGYRFGVGDDFNLLPSVMVKFVDPLPVQFDVNAKLQYLDLGWVGVGVRPGDGFSGMIGLNISNTLNVGYSYDYTTSRLNAYTKGSHEIMVGFIIGNKYAEGCPRNVW